MGQVLFRALVERLQRWPTTVFVLSYTLHTHTRALARGQIQRGLLDVLGSPAQLQRFLPRELELLVVGVPTHPPTHPLCLSWTRLALPLGCSASFHESAWLSSSAVALPSVVARAAHRWRAQPPTQCVSAGDALRVRCACHTAHVQRTGHTASHWLRVPHGSCPMHWPHRSCCMRLPHRSLPIHLC